MCLRDRKRPGAILDINVPVWGGGDPHTLNSNMGSSLFNWDPRLSHGLL